MVQLKQEEIDAFNIIAQRAQQAQQALNASLAAQKAFIGLLELKYNAIYDAPSGQFNEKLAPSEVEGDS